MADNIPTTNPSSSSLSPDVAVSLGGALRESRDISGEFTRISAKLNGILDEMGSEQYRADEILREAGNLKLYQKRFGARWKGIDVRLTARGYLMVEQLASQPGLDCSYRELCDVVRGPGFVVGDGEMGLRSVVRTWIK